MRVFHLLIEGYAGVFGKNLTEHRIDEVARFIHNSLFLSHALRRDVVAKVTMFRGPLAPLTIEISGRDVRGLHPDEMSIAGFLRKSITSFLQGEKQPPGVRIKKGWERVEGTILDEEGERGAPSIPYFYVGGPRGFPEYPPGRRISLGEVSYTASQTVAIVNYLLDVGIWKIG